MCVCRENENRMKIFDVKLFLVMHAEKTIVKCTIINYVWVYIKIFKLNLFMYCGVKLKCVEIATMQTLFRERRIIIWPLLNWNNWFGMTRYFYDSFSQIHDKLTTFCTHLLITVPYALVYIIKNYSTINRRFHLSYNIFFAKNCIIYNFQIKYLKCSQHTFASS